MTHLNCSRLPLTWALLLLYQLPIRFRDLSNAQYFDVMTQKGRLSKLNFGLSRTQVNNHSPNSAVMRTCTLPVFGLAYCSVVAGNTAGAPAQQEACPNYGTYRGEDPPVARKPTLRTRFACIRINIADGGPVIIKAGIRCGSFVWCDVGSIFAEIAAHINSCTIVRSVWRDDRGSSGLVNTCCRCSFTSYAVV